MNNIFAFFLAPLLAASAALSAIEFSSNIRTSRLQDADRVLSAVSNAPEGLPLSGNLSEDSPNLYVTGAAFEEAAMLPLSDPDTAYQAARLLYRTGLLERDQAQRIKLFCRSLNQVGQALERDPMNSRLLINWANLRQLLADVNCEQKFTTGDYEKVARFALDQDPTNSEVLFSAGQILFWAGKQVDAARMLKSFLELAQTISQPQYDFIEQQLVSARDVQDLIPAQFPQIVDWSERLQSRKPALFREAVGVLSAMQIEAVKKNEQALREGSVPVQLYFDRLSSLLEVASSSPVRQNIDAELSRYYGSRGQERLQRYLDKRRLTTTLDLVRSVSFNDTRPLKSPLVIWQPQDRVTANSFYTSIGFYLPRSSSIELIELTGDIRAPLIPALPFKLLASVDNQSWEDITSKVALESLEFARHSRLVFTVPALNYRYWKIHFASSAREGGFSNGVESLIRAYGQVVLPREAA